MNVQKLLHTCSAHWTIWKIVHIFVQKKIKPTSYQKTSQYLSLLKEYQCAWQIFLLFFIFEKAVCTSRREQGVFQTWKIGAKLLLFSTTEMSLNWPGQIWRYFGHQMKAYRISANSFRPWIVFAATIQVYEVKVKGHST